MERFLIDLMLAYLAHLMCGFGKFGTVVIGLSQLCRCSHVCSSSSQRTIVPIYGDFKKTLAWFGLPIGSAVRWLAKVDDYMVTGVGWWSPLPTADVFGSNHR